MKITVIYGNARQGSTWNCVRLFLEEIKKKEETEVIEFFLPRDLPHFCAGCFTCFLKGEDKCPHEKYVAPIAKALIEADFIVLASPVYGLDVTGGMKALIDHLCYMWISHRPAPEMFRKAGAVFTTTAGAGLSHTAKTMKNSLQFWGVKKIVPFKKAVAALKWEDVSDVKKAKIQKKAARMAKRAVNAVKRADKLQSPLLIKLMFGMMRGAMKKGGWNETDRAHWEANGWLAGKKPY